MRFIYIKTGKIRIQDLHTGIRGRDHCKVVRLFFVFVCFGLDASDRELWDLTKRRQSAMGHLRQQGGRGSFIRQEQQNGELQGFDRQIAEGTASFYGIRDLLQPVLPGIIAQRNTGAVQRYGSGKRCTGMLVEHEPFGHTFQFIMICGHQRILGQDQAFRLQYSFEAGGKLSQRHHRKILGLLVPMQLICVRGADH